MSSASHTLLTLGHRLWIALCLIAYIGLFSYTANESLNRPIRNWDMVAYIGSAASWSENDPVKIHATMLTEARAVVWDTYYKHIAEENRLSNDPKAFYQQLPFYTVKPLYIGTIYVLHKLGISTYAEATWQISAACFLLMGLLLAFWRPQNMEYGCWLLSVMALVFVGNWAMTALAGLSTPDAMATFLTLAMLYVMTYYRSVLLFVALGMLAILARPDSVMLLVGACAVFWITRDTYAPFSLVKAMVITAVAVSLYFLVKHLAGGYGWQKLFYYGFWDKSAFPAEMVVDLTFDKYWFIFTRSLGKITTDVRLLPMIGVSVIAFFCHFMYPASRRVWPWLLGLAWVTYAVRFALFPSWYGYRYYYIHYLIALRASAEMIPPYIGFMCRDFGLYRRQLRKELEGSEPQEPQP